MSVTNFNLYKDIHEVAHLLFKQFKLQGVATVGIGRDEIYIYWHTKTSKRLPEWYWGYRVRSEFTGPILAYALARNGYAA